MFKTITDTICALATPPGIGAITILRLSGNDAITIADAVFRAKKKGKKLSSQKSHTIHFGTLIDENNDYLDEVLVSIFKSPNSYTGENVVEISTHGSSYIQQKVMQTLLNKGARLATAGEFTMRAFLNGKMDLSQAEAVADLIASDSENSHKIAVNQMRGGFSAEINKLRNQLIKFASLIELELDFSEEDVEFADRSELKELVLKVQRLTKSLIESFSLGNVVKNGVPVVIIGEPNVGKSTLLNALLKENRAIVSDIAGTTRDTIEDQINIEGTIFRFIDTAGLRETLDTIEAFGIEKTHEKIAEASIILYLFDINKTFAKQVEIDLDNIKAKNKTANILLIANKTDLSDSTTLSEFQLFENIIFISAKQKQNIDAIKHKLTKLIDSGILTSNNVVVSNSRHFESLKNSYNALNKVLEGMDIGLTSDIIALDIREALHQLGLITGAISTEDLLESIFRDFCIGK